MNENKKILIDKLLDEVVEQILEGMNDYMEQNNNKLQYDSFTGTYFLHDEEWEEPMEFTEDELAQEGIYLNEYCVQ